ncbi:MAG: hypothetical protein AAGD32_16145 [Planctomycetota bacterium]
MKRLTVACLAVCVSTFPLLAQESDESAGLDALPEDRVLAELASRNLETLLNRAFDELDVPEDQRKAYSVTVALSRLRDDAATMSVNDKRRAVASIVDGIDELLPTMNDPQLLAEQGNILVVHGILDDASDLEYWGPNPTIQARLRPTVQTAVDLYQKALTISELRLAQLENQIDGPTDTADIQRYQQMDNLYRTAEYTRQVLNYYLALSLDSADPQRQILAENFMDYLRPFVSVNTSGELYYANFFGKTSIVAGTDSALVDGIAALNAVIDSAPTDVADNPDAATYARSQKYEAHYAKTIALLESGDLAAAKLQSSALDRFVTAEMGDDDVSRVYADVLKYRIADAEARDTRSDEAAKRAIDILADLSEDYPAFSAVVSQQMLAALPQEPTPAQIDSYNRLQLNALIDRAVDDYNLARAEESYNQTELAAGIAAARELVGREELTESQTDTAAWRLALFLAASAEEAAALDAFIDYAATYKDMNTVRAEQAMQQAINYIARLSNDPTLATEVAEARNRFLPIAVDEPFNWMQFAVPYARQLLNFGDVDEAARVLRRIPESHPDFERSRYFLLLADRRRLRELPADSSLHGELERSVQQLATTVSSNLEAELRDATGSRAIALRSRLAGVRLQVAESALNEQEQPARAVEMLRGIEDVITGLPNEQELLGNALFYRFRALAALGNYEEATDELLRYVEQAGPERGTAIVFTFLQTLDAEFAEAKRLDRRPQMQSLSEARVALTPQLITFAEKAGLDSAVYTYRRYDADSRRIAAEVAADPARRDELLRDALAKFEFLETAEQEQQWRTTNTRSFDRYDPVLVFGIARTQHALGNFDASRDRFGRLLQDKVLGRPVEAKPDPETGEIVQVYNDEYWEAYLKWYRAKQRLDDIGERDLQELRRTFIRYGDQAGGPAWADDFEDLRDDLLPDMR